jgi:hypothetical protein
MSAHPMTPRPEVPTLTERELWLMEKAWECSRLWRDTATAATWLATSSWDGVGYEQQCAESAPQTPAPALLTAAQVRDLTAAVEMPGNTQEEMRLRREEIDRIVCRMTDYDLARWLLAAHARVAV